MKPFHKLDCDLLPDIQQKALTWLWERYDLADQSSLRTDLWLKIDTKSFLQSNPSLLSWFQRLGLICRELAVTVVNDSAGAPLHIDEAPIVAKINIPILNYQHVDNEWYHVPDDIMSTVRPTINRFGKEFYDLGSIDVTRCDLVGSIELKSPVVFNSSIPHRVVCRPGVEFPRIVLTCMFFKEPLQYLQ